MHPTVRYGLLFFLACGFFATSATISTAAEPRSSKAVAQEVDRLLAEGLKKNGEKPAPFTSDSDFLRRVTFDLSGRAPNAADATTFVLDPDTNKRAKLIEKLLTSDTYARNWARYWRDVIYSRATDQRARISVRMFEAWMTDQFKANTPWDEVVTAMLTATGDVRKNGAAGLIFAHNAQATELAAETSRIFLGIQIQCANCHDHPTDVWKRDQFHQLAAFFPRMAVRPVRDPQRNRITTYEVVSADNGRGGFDAGFILRRYDKNKDNKLSKKEVEGTPFARAFDNLVRRIDRDKDGLLNRTELQAIRQFASRRRRPPEYYMPDLNDPSSRGKKMDPVFFVGKEATIDGLNDLPRREELARMLTADSNKWFARAYVNRIWTEMLGEGFYMPVDDLGPQRKARFPEVIDLLATEFTRNKHDVKWLFRTIANTQAYQRQIRLRDDADPGQPFAAASPTRLRGDQVYDALTQALGVTSLSRSRFGRRRFGGGSYSRFGGERTQFTRLFGFDPSTPQQDIVGTVPQALYLMNSPAINNLIRGTGSTRLARILRDHTDNKQALNELYLMVLTREPSAKEQKICTDFIAKVGNRSEAFEDILWSLLNSSEFLSKR